MKKWISILCIVLLLCSAMTMAVSAAAGTPEDPVVCTGLNFNMVKIPAGATYYISFTDTTGAAKRHISINSSTNVEAGYAATYAGNVVNSDENGYCNLVVSPDANGTYLLSIANHADTQATFFINFYDVSPYEISDISLYEGENAVTTRWPIPLCTPLRPPRPVSMRSLWTRPTPFSLIGTVPSSTLPA